jgi:hypothetical protein
MTGKRQRLRRPGFIRRSPKRTVRWNRWNTYGCLFPALYCKSPLTHPSPGPILGVGLLCNLIFRSERPHVPIRSNLAFKSEFPTCSICNESVELETIRVNEIGEPVHEECYLQEIILKKAIEPPSETMNDDRIDNSLPRAIIKFLNSANVHSTTNRCPECGSLLEYRDCTFFYGAQTWEIPLPICVKCLSGAEVSTDEA